MKSKSSILVLVVLVFFAYCCSSRGDGTVSIVNVGGHEMFVFTYSAFNTNVVTIPLSNLVESVELVQLETKEEAYFRPFFTTVTDNYIGIREQGFSPYLLFDRSGNFLGSIGSIGRGPGEYSSLYDDIIDCKNELIYLAPTMSDRILVYSTSGQFVKDIVKPHRMQKPKMFLLDEVLTVVHMPFPNNRAIAFQFDVNTGELLRELTPPAHLIVQNFDGELFSTRNAPAGMLDLLYTGNDTLYHYDVRNNRILPAFLLEQGAENRWRQHFQVNKDLIMTWISSNLFAVDLRNKTSSNINVVNDFLGNMPAPMNITTIRNGYWVKNIQPEDLMEDIEDRLAERGISDSDRQALNRALSALKENTNNVVLIGRLKSEVRSRLW